MTNLVIYCCLVDLTDVTWAVEDFNSKLVDVVSFAGVDENRAFQRFPTNFNICCQNLGLAGRLCFFFSC